MDEFAAQVQTALSNDPIAQREANQWLNKFRSTPAAWEACLAALASEVERVQHFAASMLLSKARNDWNGTEEMLQANVRNALYDRVQALLQGAWLIDPRILKRVAPAIVTVLALSGEEYVAAFVDQVFAEIASPAHDQAILYGIELLNALAVETLSRPHACREAVRTVLEARLNHMLPLFKGLLASAVPLLSGHNPVASASVLAIVQCLDRCGPAGLSLERVMAVEPGLLQQVLELLVSSQSDTTTCAVVDVVEAWCVTSDAALGGLSEGLVRTGLQTVLSCVAACRERWDAAVEAGDEGEEFARAIVKLAVAVGEADVRILVTPEPENEAVLDMLVAASGARNLAISGLAMDIWSAVQHVDPAARPGLRGADFMKVFAAVCASVMYPPTQGDDGVDIDEDEFHRFREQAAADAVEAVYAEATEACLEQISDILGTLNDYATWQMAELLAWVLRVAHLQLKPILRAEHRSGGETQPLTALMRNSFQKLGSLPSRCPELVTSVVRLFGMYASWLKTQLDLVESTIGYLTASLGDCRDAVAYAAVALRGVCAQAAPELGTDALQGILDHCMRSVGPIVMDVDTESRSALFQAMSRIISSLPADQTTAGFEALIAPCLRVVDEQASSGRHDEATVVRALEGAAAVIQFSRADSPTGETSPTTALAMAILPLLEPVVAATGGSGPVVAAAAECMRQTLQVGQADMAGALGDILRVACALVATKEASLFTVITAALEVFGGTGAADEVLATGVSGAIDAAMALDDCTPVIDGLLDMCRSTLLYMPEALLESGKMQPVLEIARHAFISPQTDPAMAGHFIELLFSSSRKRAELVSRFQATNQERLKLVASALPSLTDGAVALTQAVMSCAVERAKPLQLDALAGALYSLFSSLPEASQHGLLEWFASAPEASARCGQLSEDTIAGIQQVLGRYTSADSHAHLPEELSHELRRLEGGDKPHSLRTVSFEMTWLEGFKIVLHRLIAVLRAQASLDCLQELPSW